VPGLFAVVLSVVALLGLPAAAVAQEGAVAGQITAIGTGEQLIGVQVFVPGTSFGTLTDDAGRFRITGVPVGDYTLRASIIGYQSFEQPVTVTAGEVATVDFVLEISAVALDEVVATITGERRRRELAADISTIDATVVADNTRTSDVNEVLKGQATGVYVRKATGSVGTGSNVRIRGTGSVSLSKQPLYVIDGAIIESENNDDSAFIVPGDFFIGGQTFSRVQDLNPDEIESVEVIKGPAASALWGARGNAGVIVITTKKGAAGSTRWNARADLGSNIQNPKFQADNITQQSDFIPKPGEMVSTAINMAAFFGLRDTTYTQNLFDTNNPFRNGFVQNYNGNVTGGAGLWNYFGSVQYANQKGTLPNNDQEKFNFRANFGVDPSSKVNLSFSNGYSSNEVNLPDNDNNGAGFLGVGTISFAWEKPITREDPVTGETVETCPLAYELSLATGAPTDTFAGNCPGAENDAGFLSGISFDEVATRRNRQKLERYTGSGNATWTPTARWTNRFTLGYDLVNSRIELTTPVDPTRPFGTGSLGNTYKPSMTSRNITMQGTTTYLQPLGSSLDFEFTGGVQWFRNTTEEFVVAGQVFPATGPAVNNSVTNQASDSFDEQKSLGFFAQGQFQWNNRVFVNGAIRWDNNSAQGENLGVQTYPKFGASWVALEGQGIFNTLRFRGAWGRSGSLPGTNDAIALVAVNQVALEQSDALGISPQRPGNDLLSPETGEELEFGFDLAMLSDRLGLTFSYYDQKTKNSVVTRDLPPSEGFPFEQFTNIGQIDNKGFEVALDALAVAAENFTWDLRVLASNNTNEISELRDPIQFGLGGDVQRHQQGLPYAAYMSPIVELGDDGDPRVLPCDETPGTWGPDDTPGEKEDFCDPLDNSRYFGQPNPVWEGSFQTTFTLFKYVQLYALFDFQAGQHMFNGTTQFMSGFLGGITAEQWEVGPDGEFTDTARLKQFAGARDLEGLWLLPADWGKWRTAQIRFDMPPSVTRFLKVNGLSIQFIGENLVTWTDYNGIDPEINSNGQGVDANKSEFLTLAIPRRFLATINIFF
jgi:TonB-linked SusC/RagA family outer membrane protein